MGSGNIGNSVILIPPGFEDPRTDFGARVFFVVCESFKSRRLNVSCEAKPCFYRPPREVRNLRTLLSYFRRVAF